MKKRYKIRENSPADYIVNGFPMFLLFMGLIVVAGLITTWDMGL